MRVRSLDAQHDWLYGKGANDYLRDLKAIVQNIDTRLNSFLGDCFFDTGAGIDWFNLLGAKDQTALNLSISAVIINTDGVTALLQYSSNLNSRSRAFSVAYKVQTTYSVLSSVFQLNTSVVSG